MNKILTLLAAIIFSMSVQAKDIVLSADNSLILNTPFTKQSTNNLMGEAIELDANLKSGYPMYLFLYTPGGSIQAGLELFEFLKGLNRPIHTITLFAASMGFQTVQHLGKRYILKYGVLMSHKARGGFTGEFGGGLSQLDSRFNMWLKRIDMMDKLTVKRTKGKQTLKSYRAAYDNELWLNGEEAVEKGYADEVVSIKCDMSLRGTKEVKANLGFFSVIAEFSACPIRTAPVKVKANILTNSGEMDLTEFLMQNGKFGIKCNEKGFPGGKDYYGNIIEPKEPELCSRDKKLTLEKITKEIDKQMGHLNRNLRDHIVYSY